MIGLEEKSTTWGTGVEAQKQGFVDFTIKPWTSRWTQAMDVALLDEEEQDEFFFDFNFKDLVRGDLFTRMQSYQIARNIGMMNPNEIRAAENMSKRDGGDEYQETAAGTAPNAREESNSQPTARVPEALLRDAARRVAQAEHHRATQRGGAAVHDPEKWAAHFEKYVGGVVEPFGDAYGFESWVITTAVQRIVTTGRQVVLDIGAEKREAMILDILSETFRAGIAVQEAVA
jgi:hypothetical protein